MYDTIVNMERVMKERNEFYNEQWGIKRSKDQHSNHHPNNHIQDNRRIFPSTPTLINGSILALDLE